MKKITVFILLVTLVFCMCACRSEKMENETEPSGTTQPITMPTLPDMTMPSTNIPDPTVESHSTTPTIGDDDLNDDRNDATRKHNNPTE